MPKHSSFCFACFEIILTENTYDSKTVLKRDSQEKGAVMPATHEHRRSLAYAIILLLFIHSLLGEAHAESLASLPVECVQYNHPGLTVDLGVGLWAWPLPMDWDKDGDMDLVVSCPDVPFNGVYLFENPGYRTPMPTFKPPVRLGKALRNVRLSYVSGEPRVLTPATEWTDFLGKGFNANRKLLNSVPTFIVGKTRANQWQVVDYDSDGAEDLVVGIGDWTDYGWDNAFNAQGQWTRGPLHGWVFLLRNKGSNTEPVYAEPVKVQANDKPIDVYGMPSPNLADFDGDGDLDLICGEFLDGFSYFRNIGTRSQPQYEAGRRLTYQGQPLAMHVQMTTPTAVDWDKDGDIDLVVGDEDGRVALVENTGRRQANVPIFLSPRYFQQQARDLKFGALVTPVSVDWDGDGDEDLVCGNTSGNIGWFENIDNGNPPKWSKVTLLKAGNEAIHIQAGPNGSIQGPCEAKWGYTTLDVADWDHDGDLDLVVNSIWGKVIWYENTGSRKRPSLVTAQPIEVQWSGTPPKPAWNWWDPAPYELATQWRTTPLVVDWNDDGFNDLVMLDYEGYLAFFKRKKAGREFILSPAKRIFGGQAYNNKNTTQGKGNGFLRLNTGSAGSSGRRKLCLIDWDNDGRQDLLVNSLNVNLLWNTGESDGLTMFADRGPLTHKKLAGHTTSPTTVDWDGNGVRDVLIGAEDGRFYIIKRR